MNSLFSKMENSLRTNTDLFIDMSAATITAINNTQYVLPPDNETWFQGLIAGQDLVTVAQSFNETQLRIIAHMMAQSFGASANSIKNYNQTIGKIIVDRLDNRMDYIDDNYATDNMHNDLKKEVEKLEKTINGAMDNIRQTVNTDNALLLNLNNQSTLLTNQMNSVNTQLSQILLSQQGSSGSRQPKIGEPPEFNGTDGKVKFTEWMNKINLWIVHESITTDRSRIAVAMNKLTGAAAQYMQPWIKSLTDGGTIGTWNEFVNELTNQYGQRDEKDAAKKELTTLFGNHTLAHTDFVKYAEKFCTLGRMSEYDNGLLIDKLNLAIEKDMRITLVGSKQKFTEWTKYLDHLLDIYKQIHPEKNQGYIFSKEKKGSDAMDVDNLENKKGKRGKKGNGKEINATDSSEKKHCAICEKDNHNTKDCYSNARNPNSRFYKEIEGKKEEKKNVKKDDKKKKFVPNKKHIRAADVDEDSSSSGDEEESPKASNSSKKSTINSAEVKRAYIEEVSDNDEQSTTSTTSDKKKGKMRTLGAKDFLRCSM
jgi:hypothetical protein